MIQLINGTYCRIGGYFGVKPHDRPKTMDEKMERHTEAVTQGITDKEAASAKFKKN